MDLIIGGIYQGKLDYAKNHFGITELAARCDTVTRLFCGLPQRLK